MKGIDNSICVQKLMGQRLKQARQDKEHTRRNLSRRKLCEELLASKKAPKEASTTEIEKLENRLKQWEYGNNPVSIEWIPAICDVLGCDVGYLFGEYQEYRRVTSDIAKETGLREKAVENVIKLYRNNKIDWGLDTLNFLLESSEIEFFLYYITAYSLSGKQTVESYPLRVKKKDIFQMNMNDCLKKLADGLTEINENRPDYRYLYNFYLGAYLVPDNKDICHSIDEIREEMQEQGLEFDPKLFEGRKRNG